MECGAEPPDYDPEREFDDMFTTNNMMLDAILERGPTT